MVELVSLQSSFDMEFYLH
uniref:Uncharacterized protein n=1 Tax=Rhizophora mucronata TaxID=61149 RepID=A0A2P2QJ17_RHIMU